MQKMLASYNSYHNLQPSTSQTVSSRYLKKTLSVLHSDFRRICIHNASNSFDNSSITWLFSLYTTGNIIICALLRLVYILSTIIPPTHPVPFAYSPSHSSTAATPPPYTAYSSSPSSFLPPPSQHPYLAPVSHPYNTRTDPIVLPHKRTFCLQDWKCVSCSRGFRTWGPGLSLP
jgi:hypothetical protein